MALLLLSGSLLAATNDPSPWRTSPRLLDSASRRNWEKLGLRWDLFLNYYQGALLSGGLDAPAHRGSGSVDFIGRVDLERLAGLNDLDLLTHLKSTYGRNINPRVGALSEPLDDADFTEWLWVDQLWLRQGLLDRRIELQAGYLDQQTILDRNAYANQEDLFFMAQYLDNNNATLPLKVGLGATMFLRMTPAWDFCLGFADADNPVRHTGFDTFFDGADSLIYFAQTGLRTRLGGLPGNWRVGAYGDLRRAPVFGTGATRSGHVGAYLSCDHELFRETEDGRQGLGAFLRYGWHDAEVNRFAHFWSLGIQYDGLLPGRDADRWGGAVYSVHASGPFRSMVNPAFTRETGFETYYLVQVSPWLAVTPNLQYIVNPGGSNAADDAIAVNLRLRFTF